MLHLKIFVKVQTCFFVCMMSTKENMCKWKHALRKKSGEGLMIQYIKHHVECNTEHYKMFEMVSSSPPANQIKMKTATTYKNPARFRNTCTIHLRLNAVFTWVNVPFNIHNKMHIRTIILLHWLQNSMDAFMKDQDWLIHV